MVRSLISATKVPGDKTRSFVVLITLIFVHVVGMQRASINKEERKERECLLIILHEDLSLSNEVLINIRRTSNKRDDL